MTTILELSRAVPEDMPEAIEIIGRIAEEEEIIRDYMIGPNTAERRQINQQAYQRGMTSSPDQFWVKVTDVATGKIIASSMWQIHPTVPPELKFENPPRQWLDDEPEKQTRVKKCAQKHFDVKKRLLTHPHIRLALMFTDSEFRRRGAASMMMRWGCDLADQMWLPIWVEALPKGRKVYEHYDFQPFHEGSPLGDFMKRDAKPRGRSV